MVMVVNATFNNISAISWRSVLLVEETGVPGENHWQTFSHNVDRVHLAMSGIRTYSANHYVTDLRGDGNWLHR